MSIPVNISFNAPDPDVQPSTYSDGVLQLNGLVEGEITETLIPYVIGTAVPDVDQQGYAWIRLDSRGAPKQTYTFFGGVWVPLEPLVSARFGFFTGNPTLYFDGNGAGLKGPGPVCGDYWGWHLMNGLGGTPNLTNRFIIMGQMDNEEISGYSDGWRTNINGTPEVEGGAAEVFLDADNTYRPPIVAGLHEADGSAVDGAGPLYGTGVTHPSTIDAGNTDPVALNVVNPFYCMAMVQFTGYF